MSDQHTKRLNAALLRKETAQQALQRLQGRLAAALEDQTDIEQECLERGVAPSALDAAILQLERRYETAVSAFERDLITVEEKLTPFLDSIRQG